MLSAPAQSEFNPHSSSTSSYATPLAPAQLAFVPVHSPHTPPFLGGSRSNSYPFQPAHHQQKRGQPRHKVVFDLHLQHAALYQLRPPPSTTEVAGEALQLGDPLLWQGSETRGSLKFRLRLRSPPSICLLLDDSHHEMVIPLGSITSLRLLPGPDPVPPTAGKEPTQAETTGEMERRLRMGGMVLEMGIVEGCKKDFRLRQPNRYVRLGDALNSVDLRESGNRAEVEGDFTGGAATLTNLVRMTIHSTVTRELTTAMTSLVVRALRVKDSQPLEHTSSLDLGDYPASLKDVGVGFGFSADGTVEGTGADAGNAKTAPSFVKRGETLKVYSTMNEVLGSEKPKAFYSAAMITPAAFTVPIPEKVYAHASIPSSHPISLPRTTSSLSVGTIGDCRPKRHSGPLPQAPPMAPPGLNYSWFIQKSPSVPVIRKDSLAPPCPRSSQLLDLEKTPLAPGYPALEEIFFDSSFEFGLGNLSPPTRPTPPTMGLGLGSLKATGVVPLSARSSTSSSSSSLADLGDEEGTSFPFDQYAPRLRSSSIYSVDSSTSSLRTEDLELAFAQGLHTGLSQNRMFWIDDGACEVGRMNLNERLDDAEEGWATKGWESADEVSGHRGGPDLFNTWGSKPQSFPKSSTASRQQALSLSFQQPLISQHYSLPHPRTTATPFYRSPPSAQLHGSAFSPPSSPFSSSYPSTRAQVVHSSHPMHSTSLQDPLSYPPRQAGSYLRTDRQGQQPVQRSYTLPALHPASKRELSESGSSFYGFAPGGDYQRSKSLYFVQE